ncbi:hypothetical protein D3C81_2306050 [compost metagenome]
MNSAKPRQAANRASVSMAASVVISRTFCGFSKFASSGAEVVASAAAGFVRR